MKDPGEFFVWLRDAIRQSRAVNAYRLGQIEAEGITSEVPCADCHKCCTNGMHVPLFPAEPVWLKSEDHDGQRFLKQSEKGECFYWQRLKGKCQIYDRRPVLCRTYDCRIHLASKMIEKENVEIAEQWDDDWHKETHRALILLAIHLAALDTDKEVPGANSVMASGRGIARFPEYLAEAYSMMMKAQDEIEEQQSLIILPSGVH